MLVTCEINSVDQQQCFKAKEKGEKIMSFTFRKNIALYKFVLVIAV